MNFLCIFIRTKLVLLGKNVRNIYKMINIIGKKKKKIERYEIGFFFLSINVSISNYNVEIAAFQSTFDRTLLRIVFLNLRLYQ